MKDDMRENDEWETKMTEGERERERRWETNDPPILDRISIKESSDYYSRAFCETLLHKKHVYKIFLKFQGIVSGCIVGIKLELISYE